MYSTCCVSVCAMLSDNGKLTILIYLLEMFHADDYELQILCKGHCPFCRKPVNMHT